MKERCHVGEDKYRFTCKKNTHTQEKRREEFQLSSCGGEMSVNCQMQKQEEKRWVNMGTKADNSLTW